RVRGPERSAVEADRGRREIHPRRFRAEGGLLFDLGGVAMADRAERPAHTGPLGVVAVLARLAPAFARADLALDHHRARAVNDIRLKERKEREDRSGRVATGAGDPFRALDRRPP